MKKNILLWTLTLLYVTILVSVHAENTRTVLPVTVAPVNSSGALTPNATYAYNFVFSTSASCVSLLNISVNITTNARGIGAAELNISSLSTTPGYICEYVNGVFRKAHPVFSSMFEERTSAQDILGFGFNYTSSLNTHFIRNSSIPSCNSTSRLSSAGSGIFTCVETSSGLGAGTVTSVSAGNFMNFTTITVSGAVDLDIVSLVANIGNWSSDKNSYSTTAAGDLRWLGIADQRYNETSSVQAVNSSSLRNGTSANFATLNATVLYAGTTNLTTAQVSEAGSLYFTDSRAASAVQNSTIYRSTNPFGFYNSTTFTDYYPRTTNPLGYYNSSTLPASSANTSFNQTLTDSLYYPKNTNPLGYYNSTNPPPGSNNSWNETRADTLYSPIIEPLWTANSTAVLRNGSSANLNTINASTMTLNSVSVVDMQTSFCDFLTNFGTNTCLPHYLGAAVGTGGTGATGVGNQTRPGVVTISKGTAANSGYQFTSTLTAYRLNGSEAFAFSAGQFVAPLVNNYTVIRAGFIDSITSTAPSDGVWFEINANISYSSGTCIASTGGTRTLAGTNFTTLAFQNNQAAWYEFSIVLDSTASVATCTVYNSTSGAVIWTNTVSSNIPRTPGRETGAGFIGYTTVAGSAAPIFSVDYIMHRIQNKRRVLI